MPPPPEFWLAPRLAFTLHTGTPECTDSADNLIISDYRENSTRKIRRTQTGAREGA